MRHWFHCEVHLDDGRTLSLGLEAVDTASAQLRIYAIFGYTPTMKILVTDNGPVSTGNPYQ